MVKAWQCTGHLPVIGALHRCRHPQLLAHTPAQKRQVGGGIACARARGVEKGQEGTVAREEHMQVPAAKGIAARAAMPARSPLRALARLRPYQPAASRRESTCSQTT